AAQRVTRGDVDNPVPEAAHVADDRRNAVRTASCELETCTSCSGTEQLSVLSSRGIAERTLDLNEAAAFLHMHPEEVRARAKCGLIPGAKPGRSWVFLESDLAEFLRSLYPVRRQALQVTTSQEAICHLESAVRSGGSTSPPPVVNEYADLLRPPTRPRRRSCTTS